MNTVKTILREELLAKRGSLPPARRVEAGASFAQQAEELLKNLKPSLVGVYAAINSELSVLEHLTQWNLALPKVVNTAMIYVPWDRQTPLSTGPFHVPEPQGTQSVVPPVVFVPCVGATAEGWRLGYGAGFYDRFFAEHPSVHGIGVVFRECVLESFPAESHDYKLPQVIIV